MKEKIPAAFTRYDVRGEYPREIDESFALNLGRAAGTYAKTGTDAKKLVVVGYDTRRSSRPLKHALVSGILGTGTNVIDVGLGPSDKISLAGGHYNADFSIMITASHHEWKRNGFKFFYPKGNGFSNGDMAEIKKIYMARRFRSAPHESIGMHENKEAEFQKIYLQKAVDAFRKYFKTEISAKVIVDCCEGGASVTTPELLERLGAKVVKIHCSDTPSFVPHPEPGEENRKFLVAELKKTGADIIIGHDPDADRIYAFDSTGSWISGDELFCIFAKIVGAKKIVASLDTSKMLEDATEASVEYTRVGDIFVSKRAIEIGADFAGEPNGHYAVPTFSWYNSGTFCALLLAAAAKNIPAMRASLPKYFVEKEKIILAANADKDIAMKKIIAKVKNAKKYKIISDYDGVKFASGTAACLIRPSGTSNIIRMVVESRDEAESASVLGEVKAFLGVRASSL